MKGLFELKVKKKQTSFTYTIEYICIHIYLYDPEKIYIIYIVI